MISPSLEAFKSRLGAGLSRRLYHRPHIEGILRLGPPDKLCVRGDSGARDLGV